MPFIASPDFICTLFTILNFSLYVVPLMLDAVHWTACFPFFFLTLCASITGVFI